MKKEFDCVSMGEIMLRLSPPNNERMTRGDIFEKKAGGAELNVVSGISLLGLRTGIISKLPDSDLGRYIKNRIRFVGVSDDCLIYDSSEDARLGIYYYENGAHPRKPSVIYDRKRASFTTISIDEINPDIYTNTRLFHTSGITLALCEETRNTALEVIKRFKEGGALISFDVNYRATLWDEDLARETILKILPYVDILFVSEETCRRMMQKTGTLEEMMKSYCDEFHVSIVASTERKVISPKQHEFGSTIYSAQTDTYYKEEPYTNIDVVDRIGSGDAYCAGVLYGLLAHDMDCEQALYYGNATSATKNTIPGDLPSSDLREINRIIKQHHSKHLGGYKSEMNR